MDKLFRAMSEPLLQIEEAYHFDRVSYLFDKHRTSFLCWAGALNEGIITKNNTLVTIDLHLDLNPDDKDDKHMEIARSMDIKKIRNHVKENNKQDWMDMGMETGIIKDIIIISPKVNKEMEKLRSVENYKDSSGQKHIITYYDSIEEFEKSKNPLPSKTILDIDLDYFARKNFEELKQISDKEMVTYFKQNTKLYDVFKKTNIVTIAVERRYTGEDGMKWGRKLVDLFYRLTNHISINIRKHVVQ
jgi:hypothetical protein